MVKIPLGMEYRTKLDGEVAVEFNCFRCQHEALALVRSRGEGSATAWAFIGGKAANQRSSDKAEDDLLRSAQVLASSARCPKCGHADKTQTSGAHSSVVFQCLAVAACGFILSATSKSLGFLLAAISAVVAVVHYASSSWKWDARRVRFVTREELSQVQERADLVDHASAHAWYLCWLWRTNHEEVISERFNGTLRLGLLSRADGENIWLEHGDLGGLSAEAALSQARQNLELASEASLCEVEPGVWKGDWGDWFAATRLVVPSRFTALQLDGDAIAFTPSENTLFVAGANDEKGLVRAATLAEEHARDVIAKHPNAGPFCATPWRLTADVLEPWTPPPRHPLHARLDSLRRLVGPKGWSPGPSK